MLDFTLTPEQLSLQKKAREFALKEILPLAWFYDEADEIPMHIINKASALGLMNGDMPKKYGGLGYGSIEGSIVTEEIAAACSGVKLAGRILKRRCPAKLPGVARCADIFIMAMNCRTNVRIASSPVAHLKKSGRGNKKS